MSWDAEAELIAVSTVNRQQKKRSAGKYSISTGYSIDLQAELKRRGFCVYVVSRSHTPFRKLHACKRGKGCGHARALRLVGFY